MTIKELITNDNCRLSTTAFIQFFGALLMADILCFCVYLDRPYVPELISSAQQNRSLCGLLSICRKIMWIIGRRLMVRKEL